MKNPPRSDSRPTATLFIPGVHSGGRSNFQSSLSKLPLATDRSPRVTHRALVDLPTKVCEGGHARVQRPTREIHDITQASDPEGAWTRLVKRHPATSGQGGHPLRFATAAIPINAFCLSHDGAPLLLTNRNR